MGKEDSLVCPSLVFVCTGSVIPQAFVARLMTVDLPTLRCPITAMIRSGSGSDSIERFCRQIYHKDGHTVGIGSSKSSLVICLDNVDLLLPNGNRLNPRDVDEFPRFGDPDEDPDSE